MVDRFEILTVDGRCEFRAVAPFEATLLSRRVDKIFYFRTDVIVTPNLHFSSVVVVWSGVVACDGSTRCHATRLS